MGWKYWSELKAIWEVEKNGDTWDILSHHVCVKLVCMYVLLLRHIGLICVNQRLTYLLSDVTWASRRLKSPANGLFVHPSVRVTSTKLLELLNTVPLLGEFTRNRWISFTKGQYSNTESVSMIWRHHGYLQHWLRPFVHFLPHVAFWRARHLVIPNGVCKI